MSPRYELAHGLSDGIMLQAVATVLHFGNVKFDVVTSTTAEDGCKIADMEQVGHDILVEAAVALANGSCSTVTSYISDEKRG